MASSSSSSTSSAYHSFKVRLAIDVIKEHFGPLVAEVASLLLRSDNLTLVAIYKYFKQHAHEITFISASTSSIEPIDDPSIVRNCLLILRRHNILIIDYKPFYSMEDSTDEKLRERNEQSKTLHYSIDVDMTINRLRFPRVLLIARELVGSLGLTVLEELLVGGQSSLKTLVKIVHELIISQPDHSDEIIQLKALPEPDLNIKIEDTVRSLLHQRLIMEVPLLATGPVIIYPPEKEKKKKAGSGGDDSKRSKKKIKLDHQQQGEHEVIIGTIDGKKESDGNASNGRLVITQQKSSTWEIKHDVLYMINFEEVFRRMQYKAIVTLATQRVGKEGGKIVEVILNESLKYQGVQANQEEYSRSITWKDLVGLISVKGILSEHELKPSKASEVLTEAINDLERDAVGLISKTTSAEGDLAVHINVRSIVTFLQRKVKHSIAVERYGKWSGRIVELLERHSYLDQQAIGEMAIIPARDARERLYTMYRDKWVDYVEICKRNDYNPSSTYYFWFLDRLKLDVALQESLYKSILNLRKRRVHELEGDGSWSKSVAAAMMLAGSGMNESLEKQKDMEKLNFALDRIDHAVIQADFTAIVLGCF